MQPAHLMGLLQSGYWRRWAQPNDLLIYKGVGKENLAATRVPPRPVQLPRSAVARREAWAQARLHLLGWQLCTGQLAAGAECASMSFVCTVLAKSTASESL